MNYIKTLQAENASKAEQIQDARQAVDNMLRFLASDKFQGFDSDGDRKDWISTGDVVRWLQDLRGDYLQVK